MNLETDGLELQSFSLYDEKLDGKFAAIGDSRRRLHALLLYSFAIYL
jgi:hypothetical protein